MSNMAETNKLSVGKVLDRLRSTSAPEKSKLTQLDEKLKAQDQEIERLREARRRLEWRQGAGSPKRD
jgi:hypothetical protein